jgi:Protein of unknown function (DUF3551)
MRLAWIGLATVIMASAAVLSSSDAQHSRRFCSFGGGAGSSGEPDCSFSSFEQCRAAASGLSRYCGENPEFLWRERESNQQAPKQGKSRRQRDQ